MINFLFFKKIVYQLMKSWKSRCLGWKSIKFWSVDMKGREQYGVTYRNLLQGDMLPVRRPISLCNWTTQGPTSFLSLYVCLFCTAMPLGHVFPLARIGPIPGGTTVWFTIPLAPARPPPPKQTTDSRLPHPVPHYIRRALGLKTRDVTAFPSF